MSLRALKENKLRSILTALGIIVGTAIVIIVLSVGAGIRAFVLKQLSTVTADMVYVEVRVPTSGSKREKDANTATALASGVQVTTMKIQDSEDIKDIFNVQETYALSMGQEKIIYKNKEKTSIFWASTYEYPAMENVTIEEGRFFTEKEDKALQQVVILGKGIKEDLFGGMNAIGQQVKIKQQNFKVIGIMEERGMQFFMDMDDMIYLPVRTAQKKILGTDYVTNIMVKLEDTRLTSQTVSLIERKLRRSHNIRDPEKDDFTVQTMEESMEIIDTVTYGISLLLLSIAFISLVVGGVGIMNVMYVAVTERTKEIGLKKAVGAKPFAIRFQFLAEAVVVSVIGGIVGALIGIGISWLVSFVAGVLGFEWPFILQANSIELAFGISVFLGIVFGYAPAKKAAKMDPIVALRST